MEEILPGVSFFSEEDLGYVFHSSYAFFHFQTSHTVLLM